MQKPSAVEDTLESLRENLVRTLVREGTKPKLAIFCGQSRLPVARELAC